jgi:two-component system, cell cycle response regulator DivK
MAKILIVEDNELNREMLSRRLLKRGYELSYAGDGREAIEKAMETAPDLILMDMSLPVMDGWEATKRLRHHDATAKVPIIALTAHAMSSDRERAIEAGCDEYEPKPFELPSLLAKIERLLGGRT